MRLNEYIKIGDKIKAFRKNKGLTQRQVATQLGLPFSTYSNYENNNREPTFEILSKIAKILEASVAQLISDEAQEDEADFKFRQLMDYLDELDLSVEMDENKFCEIIHAEKGTIEKVWYSELLRDFDEILKSAETRKEKYILDCLRIHYTDLSDI